MYKQTSSQWPVGSSKDSHGSNDQSRYPQREEKEVKEKNPMKKKLAKCTSQAIKKKVTEKW